MTSPTRMVIGGYIMLALLTVAVIIFAEGAFFRHYVANAPMRRWLSSTLVALAIVCGAWSGSALGHGVAIGRGCGTVSECASDLVGEKLKRSRLKLIEYVEVLDTALRDEAGALRNFSDYEAVFQALIVGHGSIAPAADYGATLLALGPLVRKGNGDIFGPILDMNRKVYHQVSGGRGPAVLEIHLGPDLVVRGYRKIHMSDGDVGPQLSLRALSVLAQVFHKKEQGRASNQRLRNADHYHADRPEVHPLLGAQVLLAALAVLGGLYGVIHAFKHADRIDVSAGVGHVLLGICFMVGGGLYGASVLLP